MYVCMWKKIVGLANRKKKEFSVSELSISCSWQRVNILSFVDNFVEMN